MTINCERCGAVMEYDGDDILNAYVCPDCGLVATVDEGGNVYFDDEDLNYNYVVGERVYGID